MAKTTKRLTELQVKAAKWSGRMSTAKSGRDPAPQADVLPDGQGLFLSVSPTTKAWVLRLYVEGKERRIGLGVYREDGTGVSLKQAREAAERERVLVRTTGETKADRKRAEREAKEREAALAQQAAAAVEMEKRSTFEAAGREWHRSVERTLTPKHAAQCLTTLEQHVFPAVGQRSLDSIAPGDILKLVLEPMLFRRDPETDAPLPPLIETASRTFQRVGAVFEYANLHNLCKNNPAPACRRQFGQWKKQLLKTTPKSNFAALQDPREIGEMLRAVAGYVGLQTRLAIQAIAYTAVRSGELRAATWAEFDLDSDEPMWTIPAEHMKARREHHVPLSRQAVAVLRELKTVAGDSAMVLPGRGGEKPLSDMTLSMALRRLGYEDRQTVHGLRSIFSTLMRERTQFRREAIEAQLAHVIQDQTEAAYNRAKYLSERRELLQHYADVLDQLRDSAPTSMPAPVGRQEALA